MFLWEVNTPKTIFDGVRPIGNKHIQSRVNIYESILDRVKFIWNKHFQIYIDKVSHRQNKLIKKFNSDAINLFLKKIHTKNIFNKIIQSHDYKLSNLLQK